MLTFIPQNWSTTLSLYTFGGRTPTHAKTLSRRFSVVSRQKMNGSRSSSSLKALAPTGRGWSHSNPALSTLVFLYNPSASGIPTDWTPSLGRGKDLARMFLNYVSVILSISLTIDPSFPIRRLELIWLTMTQFYTYCELEFLPVYVPSEEEKLNPRLFAR